MNLEDLKKEIPYKWKIQSFNYNKTKASCVAYIDARVVMDLLDEVVGPENWQDKYDVIDGKFVAGIGIRVPYDKGEKGIDMDKEWVWKWDTGTSGDFETEKSEFSDAFKRAGVKWGIGRFLYSLEIKWIDVIDKKPVDKKGKRIWNLTEYLENNDTKIYPISNYQKIEIEKLSKELNLENKITEMLESWDYKSITDLSKDRANTILQRLREVRDERNISE